jgi:GNAT superfamily N-acetyltransferase
MDIQVQVAGAQHVSFAQEICDLMEQAAQARGTGIAKRKPEYIQQKMSDGKAIIALVDQQVAGFCYIETWGHGQYVANSGLIVSPEFRNLGLAKRIKEKAFELSRQKYPEARLFGITTSLAVMKINSDLGYKPVTFSELTTDEVFWQGCQSCRNYDILTRNEHKLCLCTGMLYDPARDEKRKKAAQDQESALKDRWERYKEHLRRRRGNKLLQSIKDNLLRRDKPNAKKDPKAQGQSRLQATLSEVRRRVGMAVSDQ